ncbi:type II toxin-antitoxin system YoeB family toxin [Odoribacter laneus]|uniref:type II toxin-antitoxin system YoeB family toxin n=1 Tax=Odoribacter laneus TaxID=626933 RepID=UPI003AB2B215
MFSNTLSILSLGIFRTPAKFELSGHRSRHINAAHRIVYRVEDNRIITVVISMRYPYKQ